MDREKLFRHLEQRYTSKRDMFSRIPLGEQPDALWQELLNRRRSQGTVLPLYSHKGIPYWYVTTPRMVTASEKIVEALFENETDFDPYTEAPTVSTLEEIFYTSYVEGSQITMQAAMDFLTGGQPPRDIEEQMIANNRQASTYAGANLYRPISTELLHELIGILTEGMNNGGQDYRTTDSVDLVSPDGEMYSFPSAWTIPVRVSELEAFLASPLTHPLIKAAAVQAYIMVLRPFPEGNERLGRLLSGMVLLRAGYSFLSDVSLSALIARKSYGYYEAMANILRDENGGDLTYFMEYFLELLSRAVDERRLRIARKEKQVLQSEQELAKTTLNPAVPFLPSEPLPPGDKPKGRGSTIPEQISIDTETDEGISLNGFQPVSIADDKPVQCDSTTVRKVLNQYARDPVRVIGQVSIALLRRMDSSQIQFTVLDLAADTNLNTVQMSTSLRVLMERGVLQVVGMENQRLVYRIDDREKTQEQSVSDPPSPKYDPAVLERINELIHSNSPKDKRVGSILLAHIDKGEVTMNDYDKIGESSKWLSDMQLAEQMGLVKKITPQRCTILRKLKSGLPSLSKGQRKIITQMYESFSDDIFSTDMVVATLDYSESYMVSCLHQFTLLRILDCRKEDIYRYRFLINPEDNPECFDIAA